MAETGKYALVCPSPSGRLMQSVDYLYGQREERTRNVRAALQRALAIKSKPLEERSADERRFASFMENYTKSCKDAEHCYGLMPPLNDAASRFGDLIKKLDDSKPLSTLEMNSASAKGGFDPTPGSRARALEREKKRMRSADEEEEENAKRASTRASPLPSNQSTPKLYCPKAVRSPMAHQPRERVETLLSEARMRGVSHDTASPTQRSLEFENVVLQEQTGPGAGVQHDDAAKSVH